MNQKSNIIPKAFYREQKNFDFSEVYNCHISKFKVGKYEVKFNFIEAQLPRLKEDFKIFEDIPGVDSFPLNVLIQRELDKERADEMYHSYLKNKGIKFYAPLIVALIPYKEQNLLDAFPDVEIDPATINQVFDLNNIDREEYSHLEAFSNSGILELKQKVHPSGSICWDKKNIHAVVIDGQHRLHSMIRYYDERDTDCNDMSVPMILLDLRDVKTNEAEQQTVAQIIRNIFISINNQQKSIDNGRLILLDDSSFPSIFTQEIFNQNEMLSRACFDIICDNGKHAQHYLTGITTVKYIISDILLDGKDINFYNIEDITKPRSIEKFITTFNAVFSFDKLFTRENISIFAPGSSLADKDKLENIFNEFHNEYKENDGNDDEDETNHSALFRLSPDHFKYSRNFFNFYFKEIFSKMFLEAYPFKKYWNHLNELGINKNDSNLGRYLKSTKNTKEKIKNELGKNDFKKEIENKIAEIENLGDEISRSVVFQKSLFHCYFKSYYLLKKSLEKKDLHNNLDLFLKDLEKMSSSLSTKSYFYSKDFIPNGSKQPFWEGIALIGESFDHTSQAVKRISYTLSILINISKNSKLRDEMIDILESKSKDTEQTLKKFETLCKKELKMGFEYRPFVNAQMKKLQGVVFDIEEKRKSAEKATVKKLIEIVNLF